MTKEKKSFIFMSVGIVLYLASFLFPYAKTISVTTYTLVSKSGLQAIGANPVRYSILLLFALLYLWANRWFKRYSIIAACFLFAYVFYLAALPFFLPAGTPFSLYEGLMTNILQVGYYLNSLLGLVLGAYLIKRAIDVTNEKQK